MQEAILHLTFTYILLVIFFSIIISIIRRALKIKKMKCSTVIILLIPFLIYIPSELNTVFYRDEFINIEDQIKGELVYYRIISIKDDTARILCIEGENQEHKVCNLYQFSKTDKGWMNEKWIKTYWSRDFGSASEYSIPPYF